MLLALHVRIRKFLHDSRERSALSLRLLGDMLKSARHTSRKYLRERLRQFLLRNSLYAARHRHHLALKVLSAAVTEDLFHVRERFRSSRKEWHAILAICSSPLTIAGRGERQASKLQDGGACVLERTSQHGRIDSLTLSRHSPIRTDPNIRTYRDLLPKELPNSHQGRS